MQKLLFFLLLMIPIAINSMEMISQEVVIKNKNRTLLVNITYNPQLNIINAQTYYGIISTTVTKHLNNNHFEEKATVSTSCRNEIDHFCIKPEPKIAAVLKRKIFKFEQTILSKK